VTREARRRRHRACQVSEAENGNRDLDRTDHHRKQKHRFRRFDPLVGVED
jgi:hypothetical protein